MKKVLSMLLALAMVLTMAAFPAFAEGDYATLTAITNPDPQGTHTSDMAVDGDEATFYAINTYKGSVGSSSVKLKFDLGETITMGSLELYWAGSGWGYQAPDSYKVYVSEDNETYTEILSQTGLHSLTAGEHDNINVVNASDAYKKIRVTESNLTVKNVRYLYIEITSYKYRATLAEVKVGKKDLSTLTPATYTVKYQNELGEEIATTKTVEGVYVGDVVNEEAPKVPGYKCAEPEKTLELVDGTNEIVFTYVAATNVTYTVNYVDAAGNPIADAKTVTAYEGDEITETAVTVAGYFLNETEFAKTITLAVDGENEITFTYKKVLVPTNVSATYAAGVSTSGGNTTDWKSFYDGTINRVVQYAPVGDSYVEGTSPIIVTYAFSELTDFTKLTTISNGNRANGVKIYTSMDGTEWTLVGTYEPKTTESKVVYTKADGSTVTTYLNTYDLTGFTGTQVRFEVTEPTLAWCGIWEMIVEGSAKEALVLDNASVIKAPNFGWATSAMDGTDATLFDGEAATDTKGYFAHSYWDESIDTDDDGEADTFLGVRSANPKNYYFIVDLGALYDIDTFALQGGAPDWNFTAPMGYNVYFAGVDGKFSTTPDHTVMKHATDAGESLTAATKVRTDVLAGEADSVRYIKIEFTAAARRPVIGEITLYGTKVDLAANPEKAGASNGAQIRLPSGTVPAGIRFGATIAKDVFGDALTTGDYSYAELAAAGIKVGMFILPVDRLGGNATLADYIKNGGENALEVAAERVYAEDDFAVTFTAVLTSIPDTAYNREIVAVPYVYIGGEYTFYAEMTRTYAAVAESVATAYEAGEIALTETQITLIEAVIGRALVAPEVAE